jgi:membrane protein DedA with SNARE-associated domain
MKKTMLFVLVLAVALPVFAKAGGGTIISQTHETGQIRDFITTSFGVLIGVTLGYFIGWWHRKPRDH